MPQWVGQAQVMRRLLAQLSLIAPTRKPVLISGETGTGKEWAAQWLHHLSGLSPWVAVNCANLKADLIESLLFGHVRGAFSGAVSDHVGFFEQAHGGTLFLDEVGDLPLSAQAALLRALQEGLIYRVGACEPRRVHVRVLCATHHDLAAMVALGTFREDLFYRLSFLQVTMPPLRERKGDLLAIARRFLDQEGMPRALSRGAQRLLFAHPWPGNVRELQQVIFRAALLSTDTIDQATLARCLTGSPSAAKVALASSPRAALAVLSSARCASCPEVAAALGVSNATALRLLNALIRDGLISRHGRTRAAKYAPLDPAATPLDPPSG